MVCYDGAGHLVGRYQLDLAIDGHHERARRRCGWRQSRSPGGGGGGGGGGGLGGGGCGGGGCGGGGRGGGGRGGGGRGGGDGGAGAGVGTGGGGSGGGGVPHQPSGAAVSEGGQQGVLDEEEGRHVVLLEH